MAYQKKVWKDLPSEETPLSADGLNNWEDRISKILSATRLPNGDMNDPQFWLGIDDGTYYTNGDANRWTNSRGGWRMYRKTGGLVGTDGGTLGRVEVLFGSGYEIATIGGSPVVLNWYTYEAETNKGANLTGGTGQTLQQVSELPIGWQGSIKFGFYQPSAVWRATKLIGHPTRNDSVWLLINSVNEGDKRIVMFSDGGVAFDSLILDGSNTRDYVVEQGTTNGIYWEKWNSGNLIQRGKTSLTGNNEGNSKMVNYAIPFVGEKPLVFTQLTRDSSTLGTNITVVINDKDSTLTAFNIYHNSSVAFNIGSNFEAIGRWK